eukprot:CAMPEP_0171319186 /NCGR_PEP_ID=MMETSP0816-20121228/94449_1 /TAXON_ID=420281 /ORGANISM="Proboscia inermis, Strain CCAP1064/1" /LENGTH=211 /DNA_ID=CAMNT_0011814577 /DNA_START=150 /DNA_END=783 /DNA_ORIENTATION=+
MTDTHLHLSYTLGDFVETYSQQSTEDQYAAVVTCFFIDTATNIYEYILTIANALQDDGLWINVGPLQWHGNAQVRLSGDELKKLIESDRILGGLFDTSSWEYDANVMNYRLDDEDAKNGGDGKSGGSTKYEGYRPLRFVVKRKKRPSKKQQHAQISSWELIQQMRNGIENNRIQKQKQQSASYSSTGKTKTFINDEPQQKYEPIIIEEIHN